MKALDVLEIRPAAAPGTADDAARRDLARLFALDRLPAGRRLACHWHRDADGRLVAAWEVDVAPLGWR